MLLEICKLLVFRLPPRKYSGFRGNSSIFLLFCSGRRLCPGVRRQECTGIFLEVSAKVFGSFSEILTLLKSYRCSRRVFVF